jgi:hypothetical protein
MKLLDRPIVLILIAISPVLVVVAILAMTKPPHKVSAPPVQATLIDVEKNTFQEQAVTVNVSDGSTVGVLNSNGQLRPEPIVIHRPGSSTIVIGSTDEALNREANEMNGTPAIQAALILEIIRIRKICGDPCDDSAQHERL